MRTKPIEIPSKAKYNTTNSRNHLTIILTVLIKIRLWKKYFNPGNVKEKLTADSISPKEHFSHSHKAGDQMLSRCQYHHHQKHNHQTLSKPHHLYHHQTHHQQTSSITNKLEPTMSAEKLCLNWNDFQENTLSSYRELRTEKEFTDVF